MQASEEEDDIIETDLFYDIKNRLRKRVTTNSLDLKEAKFSYILNQRFFSVNLIVFVD
jgi:hypothetical protein